MPIAKVKAYKASMSGNPPASAYGSIRLELDDGNHAYLSFRSEGHSLPPNRKSLLGGGTTRYTAYFPHGAFSDVIDLLRNEKPIWVFWTDSGATGHISISTSDEPPGEEEAD